MTIAEQIERATEASAAELLRKRLADPHRHAFESCDCGAPTVLTPGGLPSRAEHCRYDARPASEHATTVSGGPGASDLPPTAAAALNTRGPALGD